MAIIYVIDDNEKTCYLMQKMIESFGHAVKTECNPNRAIEFLSNLDDPSLLSIIFLDLLMPQMSGHDFIKRIKELPLLNKIPIILLTSKDCSEEMMKSYQLGAEYFMTKPASKQQLIFAINNLLDETIEPQETR